MELIIENSVAVVIFGFFVPWNQVWCDVLMSVFYFGHGLWVRLNIVRTFPLPNQLSLVGTQGRTGLPRYLCVLVRCERKIHYVQWGSPLAPGKRITLQTDWVILVLCLVWKSKWQYLVLYYIIQHHSFHMISSKRVLSLNLSHKQISFQGSVMYREPFFLIKPSGDSSECIHIEGWDRAL